MATTAAELPKAKGGAFLIESTRPVDIFTPEDFTDEHRAIARTTDEFWEREVGPRIDAILAQEPGVAVSLLRKSAELGLVSVTLPEKFGGMEMDLVSSMVVAEHIARDGSYSGWHGAHAGIGTLPILLFGTEEQKAKYLPKLASAEMVGAYCLTEPHAGSDALSARTRADLSPDGTHYLLNGQKMWITNGGAADVFTVFAKVGGEHFSAFIVERAWPGVSVGAEEKKMGIKGSSTCPIFFDNVKVPVENLLGEAGRGHVIAFNILNLGRLKLGPFAVGGSKNILTISAKYARERKAFGKSISEFGVIRHKLAEMAIRIYATESMSYRVVGQIESRLDGWNWSQPDAAPAYLKAVEEFAAECSYIKVFASETLDYVVDEGVQIHGGYGYHQDYIVERAYRDSRINRIFEGTNEINRLLATGLLLKRAQRGQLPLVQAVKKVQEEILSGPPSPEPADGPFAEERKLVENARKITLVCLGLAYQKFLAALDEQQEILSVLADLAMTTFGMESVLLRTEKLGAGAGIAADMCAVFLRDAMGQMEAWARTVAGASSEGDGLRANMAVLRRFARYDPVDAIGLRRRIAARLLEAGRYSF